MESILKEERFDYVSEADKAFIAAFTREMERMGYEWGGNIGSGYCWGRHMIIYTKAGVKSKVVAARIYLREPNVVLRLFLNKIDQHARFIEESAPAYIQEVFTGPRADCRHDRDDGGGKCQFRKTYTLEGRLIEKCNGETFEFHQPSVEKLPDYVALFAEFFAPKRGRAG